MKFDNMHFFQEESIDDILFAVITAIFKEGKKIESTKGGNIELSGVSICLTNVRARLSKSLSRGKLISPFGELLWYLSGSNALDFIKYYIPDYKNYSDDGATLSGAYGPRIFFGGFFDQQNMFNQTVKTLTRKKNSRQAVISILREEDLRSSTKDLPCTISLQFLIREDKLHLYTNMRSNDIYTGFIHDIFCFTFFHELMASCLNIEVGSYFHNVTSLHLYNEDISKAEIYLSEGYHSLKKSSMPIMETNNIQEEMNKVFEIENVCRNNKNINISELKLPNSKYWRDIALLYYSYSLYKNKVHGARQIIEALDIDAFYQEYLKKLKN